MNNSTSGELVGTNGSLIGGGDTEYRCNDTSWVYDRTKQRFAKQVLDQLPLSLPASGRVLEVGPGIGHFGVECVRRGFTYVGTEPNAALRAELIDAGLDVRGGIVPPMPFSSECADLVYASMVLEHMPGHDRATEFVAEGARVLRPGGKICLIFPNANSCGRVFWEMDYSHGYFTSPRRVAQLCEHLGLETVSVRRVLQWFWVRPRLIHHVMRHASNLVMSVANLALIDGVMHTLGLDAPLWKLRKTLFESAIVVARKPR